MEKKDQNKKNKQKISWDYIFSYGNNLALTILIASFLIIIVGLIIFQRHQQSLKPEQFSDTFFPETTEAEIERVKMDMSFWEKYQSLWYGFELQYPEVWDKPMEQKAQAEDKWEYRYSFRKKEPDKTEDSLIQEIKALNMVDWQRRYLFYKKDAEENIPYKGFDVIIYDVEKIKELTRTDEFSDVKNAQLKAAGACDQIGGHLSENENYPAEKIHILSDDDCYNSVFFYSLTRERYIYNIVPVLKGQQESSYDAEREALNNFPEFFSIASSFNLIEIKRPKPIPPKPRITAPRPVAATKRDAQGRMVCAKKDDKPSKSDKNKSKHLDMECCLDPDEYPNPWCYYDPKKYGKYLK